MGLLAMAGLVPLGIEANRRKWVWGRGRCSGESASQSACRHCRDVFVPKWKLNWLNRDSDAAALTQTRIRTSGGASTLLTSVLYSVKAPFDDPQRSHGPERRCTYVFMKSQR